MRREPHVRFREDAGVRFPRATRPVIRGKYADRFSDDCKLIVLDPDVAEAFPDAHAVDEALRELIQQRTPAGRKE
jgi:hypothetical protein